MIIDYKQEIRDQILLWQNSGNPFAYILKSENYELWIIINFQFYSFEPVPKCDYFLQTQKVSNGKIIMLHEEKYESLDVLLNHLISLNVNPSLSRAIH